MHRDIAVPFLSAGIAGAGREADGAIARRSRRDDRGGARRRAPLWPSGTPSGSIPAVAAARPLLTDPRFIEVHRLGTFPERSLDIDVVFDLMIHDLDVVLSLVDVRGGVDRSGRRAGADRPRRHRQRAPPLRQRLHREPDGEPHQPRARAEDPILPAGGLSVDRLRRAEGRDVAAGQAATAPMPSIQGGEVDGRQRGAAQARARRLRRRRARRGARRW